MASAILELEAAIDQVNLRPCVEVDLSQAVTKALEATDRAGALVVTIVLGPKIDTDGTIKSSTTTDVEAALQAPRKLQRVA